MENRIQPILCCVGADVAGEPTQFLMERAASAEHLDWHVITVEVAGDQLSKAWDGMNAMGFQAVRFFQTHQADAMRLVTQASPDDLFIGGITSALRVGDHWTMWHNSGPALLELLASRLRWSDAICWVHGSSAKTRSFLVACQTNAPRKIYWTGSGIDLRDSESETSPSVAAALPESISKLPLVLLPPDREHEIAEALTNPATAEAFSAVVHIGEFDSRHLDLLLAHQPDNECALAIVNAVPGSRRKLSDAWKVGEVLVISPADSVVAEEAFDQARWTGQPVNIELLREAYEEYVDF